MSLEAIIGETGHAIDAREFQPRSSHGRVKRKLQDLKDSMKSLQHQQERLQRQISEELSKIEPRMSLVDILATNASINMDLLGHIQTTQANLIETVKQLREKNDSENNDIQQTIDLLKFNVTQITVTSEQLALTQVVEITFQEKLTIFFNF